jgi:ATP-binding cassette subfamily B protein
MLLELPILRYLPADSRDRVLDRFVPASYTFGASIVTEGEPADALFVLLTGRARVVKNAARGGTTGRELSLGVLKPGDTFGEIGLLENVARSVTVRASGDVDVLRLDRDVFDALLAERPELRQYFELQAVHRRLNNFFKEFTAFAKLPAAAIQELLAGLDRITIPAGELLIRQGDPAGPMFIVETGRLRAFVEDEGRRRYLAYLRKGDFFGELSVFKNAPRAASMSGIGVYAAGAAQDTFARLLETYPDFRARIEERIAKSTRRAASAQPPDFAENRCRASRRTASQADRSKRSRRANRARAMLQCRGAEGSRQQAFAMVKAALDTMGGVGHFIKKGKRIRRFPLVYQIDEMDCGAACLAMVCRHFGRKVSLSRIRPLVHTSLDGSSLRGLCEAASELGLAARSVKASPANFEKMPLPAIIHWEGNHWVILYDVTDTHCRVADPAIGLRRFPRAEFEKRWSGYAALFDYTEAFEKAPVTPSTMTWLWPFFRPPSLFSRRSAWKAPSSARCRW